MLICFGMFSCGENTNDPLTVTNTSFTINPPAWLVGTWQDVDDPYPWTNRDPYGYGGDYIELWEFTTNNLIQLDIFIDTMSTNISWRREYWNLSNDYAYLRRVIYAFDYNHGNIGDSNYARYNATNYAESGTDSNYIFTVLGSYEERENGGTVKRGRFEDGLHFIKTGMTNVTLINRHDYYPNGGVTRTEVSTNNSYFKIPE